MGEPYWMPEVADLCKLLESVIERLEKATGVSRLASARMTRKFHKFEKAAEELIDMIRR